MHRATPIVLGALFLFSPGCGSEERKVGDPPPIRILVLKAFETLDWPASELAVQPPGGVRTR